MLPLLYLVLATALSGAAFYFSNGLGELWYLAWVAPLPILWLAYGNERTGRVALASFIAYAIGQLNVVIGYWGGLPTDTLFVIMLVPPAGFMGCVLLARFVTRRLSTFLSALAFPAIYTTWEYITAINSADGSAGSYAYTQAGVPEMIQTASIFGIFGVTFLLMLNSNMLALALRRTGKTTRVLAGVALLVFGANVLFGVYRAGQEPTEKLRVAMIDSDKLNGSATSSDGITALATVHAYIASALSAIKNGARVIVFPEKLAVIEPAWRYDTLAALQLAADTGKVTIVAGFDFRGDTRRNVAFVFRPNVHVYEYQKRHMVPGLEGMFQPGIDSGVFEPGRATVICKDMDFPEMIRKDAENHIRIMFVPAWDFGADGWAHARMAIMRGVENGFSIARSARMGYLTATDHFGHVVAGTPTTKAGFVSVLADVPLGPGDTIYVRIGDVFAWICAVLTLVLSVLGLMYWRRGRPADEAAEAE